MDAWVAYQCVNGVLHGNETLFYPLGKEETKVIIDGVICPQQGWNELSLKASSTYLGNVPMEKGTKGKINLLRTQPHGTVP